MKKASIYRISHPTGIVNGRLRLSSSKSISNRLLIIKQAGNLPFSITNPSTSKDTQVLTEALDAIHSQSHFDIGHTGTAMRFLTALFAVTPGERMLTGSSRMQERPIGELVNVLRQLGADIQYAGKEGFPPLRITGKNLKGGKISVDGSISSQYISALLMIAPLLEDDLEIELTGRVVSWPYIQMTLMLMQDFGASVSWSDTHISCRKIPYSAKKDTYRVEADWSSASYLFSLLSLSKPGSMLTIEGLNEMSLQGDICWHLFLPFSVDSSYEEPHTWHLHKRSTPERKTIEFDFSDCPDLAQTIAVAAAALGMKGRLVGLSTLKIKETDRILALHAELEQTGVRTSISNEHLLLEGDRPKRIAGRPFRTYHDHRMALAFAPLALVMDHVDIEDPEVIEKSYPEYWDHLRALGFRIEPISYA